MTPIERTVWESSMRTVVVGAVTMILIVVAAQSAKADGKFYWQEEVPSGIPYQRAFLVFHDGTETLAVQSKYDRRPSADVNSIGWVVPVPSVPDVASMDPKAASFFFRSPARWTSARYWKVSTFVLWPSLVAFLGGLLLMVVSILQVSFRWYRSLDAGRWSNRLFMGICVAVIGFAVATVAAPTLGVRRDVEVVKDEEVGIYDVKVIKGGDVEPVIAWLTENGLRFGDSDRKVFADYVGKGWCFVVARVGAQADPGAIQAEGMAAPLVLTFRTDEPIYPMALTGTGGTNTEVLLYTLSAEKVACDGWLPLRHAIRLRAADLSNPSLIASSGKARRLFDGLPDTGMTLCKFKGILTPVQMKEDLVFEPTSDNTPYRETRIVW